MQTVQCRTMYAGAHANLCSTPVEDGRGPGQSGRYKACLTGHPNIPVSRVPLRPLINEAQVLFEAQGRGGKSKAVDLEDMKFHQCVRLSRFENDRTISFIPPDGAFDLM